MTKTKIDETNIELYCRKLGSIDQNLANVLNLYGTPPVWSRKKGFSTLIHIILEQQVSLASAMAAFVKLETTFGEVTPTTILSLSDSQMKLVYFSRQKMDYVRNLARAVVEKKLDLEELESITDESARIELMKIKGIGRWTADIYLLMAMGRPDVMPVGDLALHVAWQKIADLEHRPKSDEFFEIAKRWKPLRSVAARILWHYYLSVKSKA
jgi:DNA-3-methyladenine glycosylase II